MTENRLHRVTGTITRPSDTNAYATGDLIANNTSAGSVTPVTLTIPGGALVLRNLTIRKSQASIVNASFRAWFLSASPTVTNGDNGAFAGAFLSTVLFEPVQVDVVALLTGGGAVGTSLFDSNMLRLTAPTYVLLEALAAYAPASAEVFTLDVLGELL